MTWVAMHGGWIWMRLLAWVVELFNSSRHSLSGIISKCLCNLCLYIYDSWIKWMQLLSMFEQFQLRNMGLDLWKKLVLYLD